MAPAQKRRSICLCQLANQRLVYGIRDYRGGGRSSARETAMRVAAGAVAKKYLAEAFGIEVYGYLSALGPIEVDSVDRAEIENNPFFCPDAGKVEAMEAYMAALSKEGNSIGARIDVRASFFKGMLLLMFTLIF